MHDLRSSDVSLQLLTVDGVVAVRLASQCPTLPPPPVTSIQFNL
uniref:Uncharacterized protein n=1 Tax=Triticum urartu TaxID=4572 RepID=A0A8R7TIP3_TRIUA